MALRFDTEKDLENFILEHESWFCDAMNLDGCELYSQVNLGPYGIADIVAIQEQVYMNAEEEAYSALDVCVIELKNKALDHSHLCQLTRYMTFFDRIQTYKGRIDVRGILIGAPTFPGQGDLCYLAQSIERVDVYETFLDPEAGVYLRLVEDWHKENSQLQAEAAFLESVCDPVFLETEPPKLQAV